jgi:hypothetical protein
MTLFAIVVETNLVVAAYMTLHALQRRMRARQRKRRIAMIERRGIPRRLRMTLRAVVAELSLLMIRIRRLIEPRRMAIPTRVRQLILIVDMTSIARNRLMRANEWECRVRMAERRRTPHRRIMTRRAIYAEARQDVPRVHRLIVLSQMTLLAIIVKHELVVSVHMALHALQRNMRTGDGKRCCVMVERAPIPSARRMALRAVVTEVPLHMIRIGRLNEVVRMAIPTRARQIAIDVVDVTFIAALTDMSARKRESRIAVIERRRTPRSRSVARRAILSEARRNVPRICRLIELRLMTLLAIVVEHELIVVVHMALRALCCRVPAREWELRRVVVERRGAPVRRRVALLAVRAKVQRAVIRVRRVVEIRLMTADAIRRRARELSVRMALRAIRRHVRARQREARVRMIECRRTKRRLRVALRAVRRIISRDVIRIRRAIVIGTMARHAVARLSCEHIIAVTALALPRRVCADERESRLVVVEPRAQPLRRALMTRLAIHRESCRRMIRRSRCDKIRPMA